MINKDDIPPEVSTGENKKVIPVEPEGTESYETALSFPEEQDETLPENPEPVNQLAEQLKNEEKENTLKMLTSRRDAYKNAALKTKKAGDIQNAIKLMKIGKQFDIVIKAVEENKEVDLTSIPGPPQDTDTDRSPINENVENAELQKHDNSEEEKLINPSNMLEGLLLRMDIYKTQQKNAEQEGNISFFRVFFHIGDVCF